jgi:3-oxoadipate enol-lactonase
VTTHHLSVRGARVAYDAVGDGAAGTLVLLHGFPHARALWTGVFAELPARAPGWRAIAPDLRGFGASDVVGPWDMDQWADDVAALLDHLGVARAVVGGLSMGGYILFALWRRHAARVRALVLADTRAGDDADQARARRGELIALARAQGADAVAESQLAGALGATTRETRPEVVAGLRALMAAQPVEGIVGALEAMRARPDSTPVLPTIAVPTLVVVGEEDALTRPSEARAMRDAIPDARLVPIAHAGHVSCWEQPAAFADALGAFLRALPPEGRAASGAG